MALQVGDLFAIISADDSDFNKTMKAAEETFTKAGSTISSIGASFSKYVTAPVIAAGAASLKFAGDFETSGLKVSTVADSTILSFDDMQKKSMEMSNTFGISASGINDALYEVISATGDTSTAYDYLEVAAKAAKGGFTDTTTAINGLTSVMNAYGLKGKEAIGTVSDQMLIAQNVGKTTFGEMAQSIGNVIPLASALKMSTAELFSSIATLTSNGIQTSEAITGIKSALAGVMKPTSEASKLASKLGLDFSSAHLQSVGWAKFLDEIKTKTGGNADSMATLFGSVEALNAVTVLTTNGSQLFSNTLTQMGNSAGATDKAFNTMNQGMNNGITKTLVRLQNLAITIGDMLAPAINSIIDKVSNWITWFTNLDDSTKSFIMSLAGVAAAIGPILMVIGAIVSFMGTLATASLALGVAMLPLVGIIVGVIAAIVAIVAVGVLLYRNWDTIKAKAAEVWGAITNFFITTGNNIGQALSAAWASITAYLFGVWNSVSQYFAGLWAGMVAAATGAWNSFIAFIQSIPGFFIAIWASIVATVTAAVTTIATTLFTAWTTVVTTIMTVVTFIQTTIVAFIAFLAVKFAEPIALIQTVWLSIQMIFVSAWEIIKNIFLGALLIIIDIITGNFAQAKSDIDNIMKNIKNAINNIWNNIKNIFFAVVTFIVVLVTSQFELLKQKIILCFTAAMNFLFSAWAFIKTTTINACIAIVNTAIKIWNNFVACIYYILISLENHLVNAWAYIKSTAINAWNSLKSAVINAVNSMIANMKNNFNNWINWIRSLPGTFYSAGSSMISSLRNGAAAVISGVKSTIVNGINAAINYLRSLPGQAYTWGRDIIQGIVNGIKGAVGAIKSAVDGVAQSIRSFLHFSVPDEGPLTDYEKWMPDFMQGMAKGIESSKGVLLNSIKGVAKDMSLDMNVGDMPAFANAAKVTAPAINVIKGGEEGDVKVNIENLTVRKESDIDDIVDKLYSKVTGAKRGRGKR